MKNSLVSAFNKETGEVIDFKNRPALKGCCSNRNGSHGIFLDVPSSSVTRHPVSTMAADSSSLDIAGYN
jgi:hypothetical protein